MIEFRCKHCGSINLELEEKGNQTGLYCCDCGKWLKWVTKEEKWLASAGYNAYNVGIAFDSIKHKVNTLEQESEEEDE